MANILILSPKGDGIPLALHLVQEENHKVDLWGSKVKLPGYINPSVNVKALEQLDQYDLILSDTVGMGNICDKIVKKGHLLLGGGIFHDKLELDRDYGTKVAKSLLKVKIPKTFKINKKEQLIEALEREQIPQVIKPLNNKSTDLTLIGEKNNKALLSIAKKWDLTPCIIQKKITKDAEISTEGWFDGYDFITPYNHTFEKKRLMEDDKGPQTGCSGCVVYPTEGDRLTEAVLTPLTPLLRKVNYKGPIDVNCILSGKDMYFLEFTTRFGYDAIQAFTELLKIPLYTFLHDIATQQSNLIKNEHYHNKTSMAVRLSVNPYPNDEGIEKWKNIQVLEIPPAAAKHVWLADVMKTNKIETLAGIDGVIGCVTANGENIQECRRRVYRTINNITIHPDVQYRSDIGKDVIDIQRKFNRWCENGSSNISSNQKSLS